MWCRNNGKNVFPTGKIHMNAPSIRTTPWKFCYRTCWVFDIINAETWRFLEGRRHLYCTSTVLMASFVAELELKTKPLRKHRYFYATSFCFKLFRRHSSPGPFPLTFVVTQILGLHVVSTFWFKSAQTHQSQTSPQDTHHARSTWTQC